LEKAELNVLWGPGDKLGIKTNDRLRISPITGSWKITVWIKSEESIIE